MTRAIGHRIALPVSRRTIVLHHPTGVEDMLLVEAARGDTALALDLAAHLARAEDGTALDWYRLPVTDLDAFVLGLRRALCGDRIVADVTCPTGGCGIRIDMSFAIGDYLAHHRPKPGMSRRRGWNVAELPNHPGWYALRHASEDGTGPVATFRLPNGADLLAVEGLRDAGDALARRCISPSGLPLPVRRRVEAAMEELSPNLAGELAGVCPECQASVTAYFDPRRFCLRELRDRARFVYDDVDVLAHRYHWSEQSILTLPAARRASYAELARQAGVP